MKKYAYINTTTGEVNSIQNLIRHPDAIQDGQVYGMYLVKELPINTDNAYWMRFKYWDGTDWADRVQRPGSEYEWQPTGKEWVVNTEKQWTLIRQVRDGKLLESDWAMLPDITHPTGLDTAWSTYRQNLRDLPSSQPDVESFDDVVWPTEPS